MGALQSSYLEPMNFKLQKQIKIFNTIVRAYPVNYFNMADVFDLEEVTNLTMYMNEQKELMRLNNPDSVAYEKAAGLYLRFAKQMLSFKSSLRLTSVSRNGTNRGKEPIASETTNDARNTIIDVNPFDSGIPEH